MNYKKISSSVPSKKETDEKEQRTETFVKTVYQVYEKEELAAEFSYHVVTSKKNLYSRAGSVLMKQFWIDEMRLASGFADYKTMDSVMHFIQYKCWTAGCAAMYVRLSVKNLFYQELYVKYGFYVIAEEEKRIPQGGLDYEYVMKYPIPESREEERRSYIRRKIND